MAILGIDTTTLVSSVALVDKDKRLAELTTETKKTHSERLMPYIAEILKLADMDKSSLEGIAVSIGPGSFTGLRIGLATAKALAYALKIPLIGVPTLTAQAYTLPVPGVLLSPILDAQKGNVYHALYRFENGELNELVPPRVIDHLKLFAELNEYDLPVLLMGEAAVKYKHQIIEYGKNMMLAEAHVIMPNAASVALLGYKMWEKGLTDDVLTLEPFYIRRSEAEVLWEKRHGVCS